ncbi:hypothetical protein [Caudoviricetes sp.]|nr:hypothetical protein [Caudoviricetes sp.]
MFKYKKFRSPGEDIRALSNLGHIAIVSKDFISLPDCLWSSAYAQGAISEDMIVSSVDEYVIEKKAEQEEKKRSEREELKDKLRTIIDNPNEYLDGRGNLSYRKALSITKMVVKKDLLDEVWSELINELEEK